MYRFRLSVLGVAVFAATPLQAQDPPIFVGIVNEWGVAVPAGVYFDGEWGRLNATDFGQQYRALGRGRGKWEVVLSSGVRRSLESGPMVMFPGREREPYWGLLTDFGVLGLDTSRRPDVLGAMVSAPHELTPVSALAEYQPQHSMLVSTLRVAIDDWDSPEAFVIEEAYVMWSRAAPDEWVYFRAERWLTGDEQQPGCYHGEVVRGWVRNLRSEAQVYLSGRVRADSCERKG